MLIEYYTKTQVSHCIGNNAGEEPILKADSSFVIIGGIRVVIMLSVTTVLALWQLEGFSEFYK